MSLTNDGHNDGYNNYEFWSNNSFDINWYFKILLKDLERNKLLYDDKNESIFRKCQGIISKTKGNDGWSQARQDWIIYNTFFYGKLNGIYLDIGAHEAFLFSNTAFFDLCMGWKGICVEPLDVKQNQFKQYRSCQLAQHCAYSKTMTLRMSLGNSAASGDISKIIPNADPNNNKLFQCQGISAQDLMNRYKPRNKYNATTSITSIINDNTTNLNIIDIDFISLDIEGAELDFLKCFPFNRYNVKVWTIETNKKNILLQIDELMYHYGYIKYQYLNLRHIRLDTVYIKNDKLYLFQTPYIHHERWQRYTKCE